MQNLLLILSYLGKTAGFIAALNAIPFVNPNVGAVIFFIATLVEDTVNRLTAFLAPSTSTVAATPNTNPGAAPASTSTPTTKN